MSQDRTAVLGLVAGAATATAGDGCTLVAIDGASGTGKSTFADELGHILEELSMPVVRASIDSFHRPRADRYRLGIKSPLGYYRDSHDLAGLRHNLLEPFVAGTRSYRRAMFDDRFAHRAC